MLTLATNFQVIQSWYVMGRLGAFNSSNLQVSTWYCINYLWGIRSFTSLKPSILQMAHMSMDYDPLYDADKGMNVMPSSFHDIGDVEFQDNWGRFWYRLSGAIVTFLSSTDRISLKIFFERAFQGRHGNSRLLGYWCAPELLDRFEFRVSLAIFLGNFFVILIVCSRSTCSDSGRLRNRYLGIQQVVFGGRRLGDWEEGMTDAEFGYKYFKI